MDDGVDRRELLIGVGCGLLVGCKGGLDLGIEPDFTFDEVLDALHETQPSFDGGLSNHGPMAMEALETLGLDDRIARFVDTYGRRLELRGAPGSPVTDQVAGLGSAPFEAWLATWLDALEADDPQTVFATAWDLLAPGLFTAGWHGLLRTAHAVRSLQRVDSPSRRIELAHGLAYWASWYETLPGDPGAQPQPGLDVVAALEAVPVVPASQRVGSGTIPDRLAPVYDLDGFDGAVAAVDLDALEPGTALSEMCAAAARMSARAEDDIVLVHAVTGTSAVRLVLPWLSDAQQRVGVAFAFQAMAMAVAATGTSLADVPRSGATRASVLDLADGSDDEHSIKLAEAALREHAVEPHAELLDAADAWG